LRTFRHVQFLSRALLNGNVTMCHAEYSAPSLFKPPLNSNALTMRSTAQYSLCDSASPGIPRQCNRSKTTCDVL
jgi:hypothetical protein